MEQAVDVLVTTRNRLGGLLATLSGIALQVPATLRLVIADQSDYPVIEHPAVASLLCALESRGGGVDYHHRLAAFGPAEQNDFLLMQAESDTVLYLGDEVFMEPWVIQRMAAVLRDEGHGFVAALPSPLAGHVPAASETIVVCRVSDPRQVRLERGSPVDHCVMYNRQRLLSTGGFTLRRDASGLSPETHIQNRLLQRWGGCAISPSGTYLVGAGAVGRNGHRHPDLSPPYAASMA